MFLNHCIFVLLSTNSIYISSNSCFQENARKEAEKKFASTLHDAGVNDHGLVTHGSGAPSVRSIDVENEILIHQRNYDYADQTYTKDMPDEDRYESDHESI